MTPTQITLVQDSFAKVVPIADTATELFYHKLFEMDPTIKPMFKSDMKAQSEKLMKMIGMAVAKLDQLDDLVPVLKDLAVRHAGYNVKPEHYNTVGGALLWILGKGLGDAFTAEVKEAWTTTYQLMASTTIEAAYSAA